MASSVCPYDALARKKGRTVFVGHSVENDWARMCHQMHCPAEIARYSLLNQSLGRHYTQAQEVQPSGRRLSVFSSLAAAWNEWVAALPPRPRPPVKLSPRDSVVAEAARAAMNAVLSTHAPYHDALRQLLSIDYECFGARAAPAPS